MYRIRWPKSVNRKLLDASAKANAPNLTAILTAMSEVESIIQNDPEFVGESRDADKRVLIVDPLFVTYKIDSRRRIVKILRVRLPRIKD
jgi:glutathione synthase/RimK-type ligase-like ATP-grasp enzyme